QAVHEYALDQRPLFRMSRISERESRSPITWPGVDRTLVREDLVHDFGTRGDHGPEFLTVHDFGGARTGVPDKAGDLLHEDARVGHEADERGPQFPGRPVFTKPGLCGDLLEGPAHVSYGQRSTCRSAEHQPMILPDLTGEQPLLCLPPRVLPQGLHSPL